MNDEDLRALVREAVARHLGRRAPDAERSLPALRAGSGSPAAAHPSHQLYLTVVNVGDACVIEPNVTCEHCGYCRSHGH